MKCKTRWRPYKTILKDLAKMFRTGVLVSVNYRPDTGSQNHLGRVAREIYTRGCSALLSLGDGLDR